MNAFGWKQDRNITESLNAKISSFADQSQQLDTMRECYIHDNL